MNPAFSVVVFTTLAGVAQGTLVALSLALLVGDRLPSTVRHRPLTITLGMLLVAPRRLVPAPGPAGARLARGRRCGARPGCRAR